MKIINYCLLFFSLVFFVSFEVSANVDTSPHFVLREAANQSRGITVSPDGTPSLASPGTPGLTGPEFNQCQRAGNCADVSYRKQYAAMQQRRRQANNTTSTQTPRTNFGFSPSPSQPRQSPCVQTRNAGSWGSCEGAFGSWNTSTHTRVYEGQECRMITTSNSCGGGSSNQECRPCGYEQVDTQAPVCLSEVDWTARPLESRVSSCEDALAGCDESAYTNGSINGNRSAVSPASACDKAGNCAECPVTNPDNTAPTCTATFLHPGRWHRDENFEVNGGSVRCWLERCEDEGVSGCLPLGTLESTPKSYDDPGGMREQVQVEQDPLDPVHRDTCMIQVCDNAGNCSTCESPEIAYDGTNVCRSSDGQCGDCAENDYDCRCISGEREACRDSGPVNCYVDPFHERCPGFENQACLSSNLIPGCPVFNPCYPEANRDHPRNEGAECPEDAIRFCARNPYHYGCNEACASGLMDCDPEVPDGA